MNKKKQIENLVNRHYSSIVFLDSTTDDEPIYVAIHPELEGCIAQGETILEAKANLETARFDFIEYLLENNLPIPEPQDSSTIIISNPIANEELSAIRLMKNDIEHGEIKIYG